MTAEEAIALALGYGVEAEHITGWDYDPGNGVTVPPMLRVLYDGEPPVNTVNITVQIIDANQ